MVGKTYYANLSPVVLDCGARFGSISIPIGQRIRLNLIQIKSFFGFGCWVNWFLKRVSNPFFRVRKSNSNGKKMTKVVILELR